MTLIIACLIGFNAICISAIFYKFYKEPRIRLSTATYIKLTTTGILSFVSDTIGVGSFAVNIALAKLFGTFHDDELPAMNNGAQVIPGVLESVFFMHLIPVDMTTLITLVSGTCVGGVVGARILTRLNKQAIRFAMVCCFTGMIGLLLVDLFHLLPTACTLTALHSWKLGIGFVAMAICGSLTCVGIGLYAMVQAVLFLLGVSPAIAFPIMTTAGALQQPLSTLVFLQQNKIPMKKMLVVSLAGCVGVLIALPIVSHLNANTLHALLLLIILFNLRNIGTAYLKDRRPPRKKRKVA